jgi:hypothetical protein
MIELSTKSFHYRQFHERRSVARSSTERSESTIGTFIFESEKQEISNVVN